MANHYQAQRQVLTKARMFTQRGWMIGTTRLVPGQTVLDFLEHGHRWITLTNVMMDGYDQEIAYLSFQRSAIGLLVAPYGQVFRPRAAGEQAKVCTVLCLFQQGAVRGQLEIPARARVSDFFMNRDGFVQLLNAQIRLPDASGQRIHEAHELAVVNTAFVVGVSELPGQ